MKSILMQSSINIRELKTRYIKYSLELSEVPETCDTQILRNLKFLKKISYDSYSEPTKVTNALLTLKNCRKTLEGKVLEMKHKSQSQIAELFPKLEEYVIPVDNPLYLSILLRKNFLKKLTITLEGSLPKNKFVRELLKIKLVRFMKQIRYMKNLKVIKIDALSQERMLNTLNYLNSLVQECEHLEGIVLGLKDDLDIDPAYFGLKIFKLTKKISQHNVGNGIILQKVFNEAKSFENLSKLTIGVSKRQKDNFNLSYFKHFKNLNSVTNLRLYVALVTEPLVSFLQNFSLPKGLEYFEFKLETNGWDILMSNAKGNPFENNQLFKPMLEAFESLKQLKFFKVISKKTHRYYPNLFSIAVVKYLGALENFSISATDASEEEKLKLGQLPSREKFIDLGLILSNFPSMNLKTLSLKSPTYSLINFWGMTASRYKLTNIEISGTLIGLDSFPVLSRMLLDNKGVLTVKDFRVKKKEFKRLLKSFLKMKSSISAVISIICQQIEANDFLRYIGWFLRELSPYQNLMLELQTNLVLTRKQLNNIGGYLNQYPKIENLCIRGSKFDLWTMKGFTNYEIIPSLGNSIYTVSQTFGNTF